MKKYILVIFAIIAGALIYFALKSKESRSIDTPVSDIEKLNERGTKKGGSVARLAEAPNDPGDNNRASTMAAYEGLRPVSLSDSQWEKIVYQYLLGKRSNGGINFYGKVIDADGMPLSGVLIKVHVEGNEEDLAKVLERQTVRAPDKIYEISSQQDGRFEIANEIGTELIFLEFKKEGYLLEGPSWFSYETEPESVNLAELGEAGNPVVFKMVQK